MFVADMECDDESNAERGEASQSFMKQIVVNGDEHAVVAGRQAARP